MIQSLVLKSRSPHQECKSFIIDSTCNIRNGSSRDRINLNSTVRQRVLLLFIDGIGLGPADPAVNPLIAGGREILKISAEQQQLPFGGLCVATDACLGVAGLPQSATGQTTLFTGINAAKAIGRHLQGFPNRQLRQIIGESSLFKKVIGAELNATFANAYTHRFFEKRPRWTSVTTTMCETANVRFRTMKDLESGSSLFMDYSNRFLIDRGIEIPSRSPEEAAEILVRLASRYDLCVYEYFLTDLIGHRGTFAQAKALVAELDRFISAVLDNANLEQLSVILTSDHGNLEDMRTKLHTTNPVPTMIWGPLREHFSEGANGLSLTDLTPRITRFLTQHNGQPAAN